MIGEPFDSRDGIWNPFKSFNFSELSTAATAPFIAGLTRLIGTLSMPSRKETFRGLLADEI
jgi:hypothetical protein